jgi:hypothetical protein
VTLPDGAAYETRLSNKHLLLAGGPVDPGPYPPGMSDQEARISELLLRARDLEQEAEGLRQ